LPTRIMVQTMDGDYCKESDECMHID